MENVDGQLKARPSGPGRLLFCVNRGSEVFECGRDGPQLLTRRTATSEENAQLDRAAALTVDRLKARGVETTIVAQRLNRRKVDIIPLAEWADPPKARIVDLLHATEARSTRGGNRIGRRRCEHCARSVNWKSALPTHESAATLSTWRSA